MFESKIDKKLNGFVFFFIKIDMGTLGSEKINYIKSKTMGKKLRKALYV